MKTAEELNNMTDEELEAYVLSKNRDATLAANAVNYKEELRSGLSADCQLDGQVVMAILMGGREHPCDHCNMDRNICRGYPRK